MIFIFHSLYFIVRYLVRVGQQHYTIRQYLKLKKLHEEEVKFYSCVTQDAESNIKFDPPVFRQRYQLVQQILLHELWRGKLRKLVDFGCAEFGLFRFLKGLHGLQEMIFVDVDEDLLRENKFRVYPQTVDYLDKRVEPLTIQIFAGSISDPDCRLLNADVVVGIEIIEHLYPDALEALPYNIFEFIQPKLVIFTTPNADFNVLFPDFNKRRHWDHKFEWTRAQFEAWALNITVRFPQYRVLFDGVAPGPEGMEHLGYCTQAAIFIRNDFIGSKVDRRICNDQVCNCAHKISHGICTHYSYTKQRILYEIDGYFPLHTKFRFKLIEKIEYPFEVDKRTEKERILDETMYKIHTVGRVYGRFFNEEKNRAEIPLIHLISNSDGNFITTSELRKLLENSGNKIEECVTTEFEDPVICVIYEPMMDSNTNSTTPTTRYSSSDLSHIRDQENFWDEQVSDWDADDKVDWKLNPPGNSNDVFIKELLSGIVENIPNNPYLVNQESTSCEKVEALTNIPNKLSDAQNYKIITTANADVSKVSNKYLEIINANNKIINGVSNERILIPKANVSKRTLSKDAVPGTSNLKKRKKFKKSESDDSVVADDVKNLSECIVINSLNRTFDEPSEIIQNVQSNDIMAAAVLQENDLNQNIRRILDDICDRATKENTGVRINESLEVRVIESETHSMESDRTQNDGDSPSLGVAETSLEVNRFTNEIAYASREALFDPNSQVDLLDDFEVDSLHVQNENIELPNFSSVVNQIPNVIVIGVRVNDEDNVLMPANADPFPNWLLQLLGAEAPEENNNDQHDEPHFYCQGDGVGVHPSIIEVDIEEDQTTSESSSNSNSNSNDDAEAEPTISEPEVVSLPEDNNEAPQLQSDNTVEVSATETTQNDANSGAGTSYNGSVSIEEYFDTVETMNLLENEHDTNNVNSGAKQ